MFRNTLFHLHTGVGMKYDTYLPMKKEQTERYKTLAINSFQSNFSTTRILPSSYLFWAGKRLVGY
jgi:hypothetical protein